jgi:hypothetical protein
MLKEQQKYSWTSNSDFLVRTNERIPVGLPTFLDSDFGNRFVAEYTRRNEIDFKGNQQLLDTLNIFKVHPLYPVFTGTTPPAVVRSNEILMEEGLRATTHKDIEDLISSNLLNLKRVIVDTALILRAEGDGSQGNSYIARKLSEQLKQRKDELTFPVVIPYTNLTLTPDLDSLLGFSFSLRDDSKVFYDVSILNGESGNFSSSEIDEESGIPEKLNKRGDRYLFTGKKGLSRLAFDEGNIVYSSWADIITPRNNGRLVVVKNT